MLFEISKESWKSLKKAKEGLRETLILLLTFSNMFKRQRDFYLFIFNVEQSQPFILKMTCVRVYLFTYTNKAMEGSSLD